MKTSPPPAETLESKPRPSIVSAKVPCTSSQARTQREQTMHLRVEVEVRVRGVLRQVEVVRRPRSRSGPRAEPDHACHVLQLAVTVGRAGEAVERVVGDVELHDAAAQLLDLRRSACCTFMPSAHRGGAGGRGAASRRRSRRGTAGRSRTPRGCRWRTAWGRRRRPAAAARITEVPSGTRHRQAVDLNVDRGRAWPCRRSEVGFLESGVIVSCLRMLRWSAVAAESTSRGSRRGSA